MAARRSPNRGDRRARRSCGASRSDRDSPDPPSSATRVILFHRVGSEEVLESLDAATGNSIWRYAYRTTYRDDFGFDEGPRAVPVVADGVIYTFGAEGQLHAVDLAKGTRLWSEDTMKRFGVPKGFFGAAGSPLVEGGRVIANVGGDKAGIVAFEAKTGKVLWTATDDDASYSSGVAATIGGRRSAVFLTRDSLVGLDPVTGCRAVPATLASTASRHRSTPPRRSSSATRSSCPRSTGRAPVCCGSTVRNWSTSGRQTTCSPTTTPRAFFTTAICTVFTARQEFGPSLRAVEFQTGTVKWSQEQFRAGSVLLAGDRLSDHARGRRTDVWRPPRHRRFDRSRARRSCRAWSDRIRHSPTDCSTSATRTRFSAWICANEERAGSRRDSAVGSPPSLAPAAIGRPRVARALLDRAIDDFLAGRVKESVTGFDRVATLAPDAAPQLWQRGIALVLRRSLRRLPQAVRVAPHGQPERRREPGLALPLRRACRVAAEGARRAAAGRTRSAIADARESTRCSRERCRLTPCSPRRASHSPARFFAELYVGLYYEATGNRAAGLTHLKAAASESIRQRGRLHASRRDAASVTGW